jgi:hypothetical protein
MKGSHLGAGVFRRNLNRFLRRRIWSHDCSLCKRAIWSNPDGRRAQRLAHVWTDPFGCERCRLSIWSPGRVNDDEILHLIITDPQSVDPRSGQLLPIAVNQIDRAGQSVLREAASNRQFRWTYAEMKKASDARGIPRFFHGVCSFPTRTIRYDNNARLLGVYDTALLIRRHHADLFAPPLGLSRRDKERRTELIIRKIGHNFSSVANFRDGAFLKFARP